MASWDEGSRSDRGQAENIRRGRMACMGKLIGQVALGSMDYLRAGKVHPCAGEDETSARRQGRDESPPTPRCGFLAPSVRTRSETTWQIVEKGDALCIMSKNRLDNGCVCLECGLSDIPERECLLG